MFEVFAAIMMETVIEYNNNNNNNKYLNITNLFRSLDTSSDIYIMNIRRYGVKLLILIWIQKTKGYPEISFEEKR